MKPPRWTSTSIELEQPPICIFCIDDQMSDHESPDHSQDSGNGEVESAQRRLEHDVSHEQYRFPAGIGLIKSLCRLSGSETSSSGHSSTKRTRAGFEPFPPHKEPKKKRVKRTQSANQDTTSAQPSKDAKDARRPTHVSIFNPLQETHSFTPLQTRPLPKWMSQLPSSRQKELDTTSNRPPLGERSPLQTRTSSGSGSSKVTFHTLGSKAQPTEGLLTPVPPAKMVETNSMEEPKLANSVPSRAQSPVSVYQSICPSPAPIYPYFQNPRAPILPAVESTWNIGSQRSRNIPITSTEYLDKYNIAATSTLPLPCTQTKCPICEEEIANVDDASPPPSIKPSDSSAHTPTRIVTTAAGITYHTACLTCRSCLAPFSPNQDDILAWTFLNHTSPYHSQCLAEGSKPILERLKSRLRTQQHVYSASTSVCNGRGGRGSTRRLASAWLKDTAGNKADPGTKAERENKPEQTQEAEGVAENGNIRLEAQKHFTLDGSWTPPSLQPQAETEAGCSGPDAHGPGTGRNVSTSVNAPVVSNADTRAEGSGRRQLRRVSSALVELSRRLCQNFNGGGGDGGRILGRGANRMSEEG